MTLEDDIDGTADPSVRTVAFSWDGTAYEVDLNGHHYLEMQALLRTYIDAGRLAGRSRPVRPRSRTAQERQNAAAVRKWARENGVAVDDRGRIPASVWEQYEKGTK